MIHPDLIQCSIALAYNTPRTQAPLYPPSGTQSPVSNEEFYFYYRGIPSNPLLIARSSARHTAWVAPTGPEAYPQRKELRSVGTKHELNELWEDHLVKGFLELLEKEHVDWTSVDVLRIVDEGQPTHSKPPIIWVGVVPDSLDTVRGLEVALKCKAYLPAELDDVEVEFRESVVNFLGGSSSESNVDPSERREKHQTAQEKQPFRFLTPPSMIDSSGELRRSLTATLGQSIAAQSTSWSDCTGSFFVSLPNFTSSAGPEVQVGDSSATTDNSTSSISGTDRRIFLVSARHALLPLNVWGNKTYDHDASSNDPSNPHNKQENVLLLGDTSFAQYLGEIQEGITDVAVTIEVKQHNLERLQRDSSSSAKDPDRLRRDDEKRNEALKRTESELVMLHRSLEKHTKYFQLVLKNYSRSSSRVFGHIAYSPPLSLSSSESMSKDHHTTDHTPFLLDYALIELSPSTLSTLTKENFFAFGGNVIHLHSSSSTSLGSTDLGSELSFYDVGMMLDPVRAHRWQEPQKKARNKEGRSFDYPVGGLMTVGTEVIGVREMRRPVRLEVGGGGAEDKAKPEEKEEKDNLDEVEDKVDVDEDKNGVDDSAEEEDPSYAAYMAEYKLKEELRKKYAAEDADDPDVMVLKRGHATGLTIGRAGTIFSYIRHTEKHMPLGSHTIAATATASSSSTPSDPASAPSSAKPLISKAWPILSYGTYPYKPFHNRGRLPPPFASHGDSGALVVDVLGEKLVSSSWYAGSTGRLGGILTSGAGGPDRRPIRWGDVRGMFDECDVAYALPVEVLLRDLVGRAEGRFGKVEVGVGVRPE